VLRFDARKILQRVLSNTAVFDTLWRDLG
jgi:hypothetical protein